MGRLTKKSIELFESIKKIDEKNQEYWTARDLAKALEYSEYRNFLPAARKAWNSCRNSGVNPADHFVPFNEMVKIGSNAERQVDNVKMTRYACYLSVQNADSRNDSWLRLKHILPFRPGEQKNYWMHLSPLMKKSGSCCAPR